MSTNVLSAKDIQRKWHLIDVKDQVLGRVAVEIAGLLKGRNKVNYVPYLDMGDIVVVTNAALVKVTGKKGDQKLYTRHSGFPGGLKQETFNQLIARRPEEVIKHAVRGMLPKTKLGDVMIKKLHIYAGTDHPHAKQVGGEK